MLYSNVYKLILKYHNINKCNFPLCRQALIPLQTLLFTGLCSISLVLSFQECHTEGSCTWDSFSLASFTKNKAFVIH